MDVYPATARPLLFSDVVSVGINAPPLLRCILLPVSRRRL
jgi:hypothetical protein